MGGEGDTKRWGENYGFFENPVMWLCYPFNLRYGIWGCFRLSIAANYDLSRALGGV